MSKKEKKTQAVTEKEVEVTEIASEVETEVVAEVEEEKVALDTGVAEEVAIFTSNGRLVRVYSKEFHGKDYDKHAEAFVEKYSERGYRLEE